MKEEKVLLDYHEAVGLLSETLEVMKLEREENIEKQKGESAETVTEKKEIDLFNSAGEKIGSINL